MTMQTTIQQPAGALLASRAMLSTLSISMWSARKTDKRVTREVHEQHHVDSETGRYSKQLIAKGALEKIQSIASEARAKHYAMTQPWLDNGSRILPAKLFVEYANAIREFRYAYESAVAEFIAAYPDFVQAARVRLNGMFNEADYPSQAKIAKAFEFATRVFAMPESGVTDDVRLAIGDAQADDIRKSIEAATTEALAGAIRDAFERIADVVGRMVERLNAYEPGEKGKRATGVFHETLVSNIADLVSVLPAFNLTGDPVLSDVTARMERELCAHTAEELRESEVLRADTAKAAADILSDIQDFIG